MRRLISIPCIILSIFTYNMIASDGSLSDMLENQYSCHDELTNIRNNLYETQLVLGTIHRNQQTPRAYALVTAWGNFISEQQNILSSEENQHKVIDLVNQRCNILKHIAAAGIALGNPLCFTQYSPHSAIHVSQNQLFAIPGNEMLTAQVYQKPLSQKESNLYQNLREANQLQRIGYMLYNLRHIKDWLNNDIDLSHIGRGKKDATTPALMQESEDHRGQVDVNVHDAKTLAELLEADEAMIKKYTSTKNDVERILNNANESLHHHSDKNTILSDHLTTGLQLIYEKHNKRNIIDIVDTYNSILNNVQDLARWKHLGYLPNPPFIQGDYVPFDDCSLHMKGSQSVRDMYGATPAYQQQAPQRRIDLSLVESKNMLPYTNINTLQPHTKNTTMCELI